MAVIAQFESDQPIMEPGGPKPRSAARYDGIRPAPGDSKKRSAVAAGPENRQTNFCPCQDALYSVTKPVIIEASAMRSSRQFI